MPCPTRTVRALVLLLLFIASSASAQTGTLVLYASADPSQSSDLGAWVHALAPAASTMRELRTSDCVPESDVQCALASMRAAHAARILVARAVWERGRCVSTYDASGAVVGRRMLRRAVLELHVLDARGRLARQVRRPLAPIDPSAAASVALALGLR